MGLKTHHTVANAWAAFKNGEPNYGLALEKFPEFIKDKFQFIISEKKELIYKSNFEPDFLMAIKNRNDLVLQILNNQGYKISTKSYTLDWRIAVGLGTESVYETGLTLHPVYGFPYIPASGLKGVVRSYIIQICFDGKEELALGEPEFVTLFGDGLDTDNDSGNRGKVLFLDAFPTKTPIIKADIINPHYREFFDSEGKVPPADYFEPVPVSFLSVEKTAFQFSIAVLSDDNMPIKSIFGSKKYDTQYETSSFIMHWLDRTLTEAGAGAKTTSGYGQFKNSN